MDEKIEKTDDEGTDRRDFIKKAAKMAGALAAVSAIGSLVDESEAQVTKVQDRTAALGAGQAIKGAELKFLKSENKKQFGLGGVELGKVLQSEGFIPANIKNLEKASLHVSVSW